MPWFRTRDARRPHRRAADVTSIVPRLVIPILAVVLAAPAFPPSAAAQPPRSREELLRQWDVDRNGTVDASEAEVAKRQLRRARTESLRDQATDPVSGRPLPKTDPLTGRPVVPQPTSDDDLILVPGNGDRPGRAARSKVMDEDADAEETRRPQTDDRPALPGTRVPQTGSLVPSGRPQNVVPSVPGLPDRGAAPGPGRGAAPASGLGTAPRQPWEQLRGQPRAGAGPVAADRPQSPGPGIISGGLRAGMAPARPGYGAPGAGPDLNAGRASVAPPQTRGGTASPGGPGDPGGASRSGLRAPMLGGSRPLPARGSVMPSPGPAAGGVGGPVSGMQPPRPALPASGGRPAVTRPPVPRGPIGFQNAPFDR